MTEEYRREIAVPGYDGTVRLSKEAQDRENRERSALENARELGKQAAKDLEARKNAGKINVDELLRQKGEREIEEFRKQQLSFWKSKGGTEEEFRQNWPEIKAAHIRRQSEESMNRAWSPY